MKNNMRKLSLMLSTALVAVSCGAPGKLQVNPENNFPIVDMDGGQAIVAHRGYWLCEAGGNSQNSIASLKAAQNLKFWGSECDIHITADDRIIVNHDNDIDGLAIAEHTFAELSSHLLQNGETRPSFDELLDQAKKGSKSTILVVEFKVMPSEARQDLLIEKALAAIKAHGLYKPSKVAFISFSHYACKRIAELCPGFINQYLMGDIAPAELAGEGINGIDYHYNIFYQHPDWVKQAHDCGMSVNVWTVDNRADMEKVLAMGVDAVTTNYPEVTREVLGGADFKK